MNGMVSLIIPVYQVRNYLEYCLRSIEVQDYRNLEILIVDDYSSDGSLQIAKEFAKRDERIKIIQNSCNQGLGASRNIAMSRAQGEYIMFLDSDDSFSSPKAVSYCVNLARKHKLEVLCCGYYLTKYDKSERNLIYSQKFVHNNLGHPYKTVFAGRTALKYFYWNTFFAVWMRLYRKDFLDNNKIYFDEKLRYEDVPFTPKVLALSRRVMVSDFCLVNYRLRNKELANNSITQDSYNQDIIKVFKLNYNFLQSQGLYNSELGYAFMWALYMNAILHISSIKSEILEKYYSELRALIINIYKDKPFLPIKIPNYAFYNINLNINVFHRRQMINLMQSQYPIILAEENITFYLQHSMQEAIKIIDYFSRPLRAFRYGFIYSLKIIFYKLKYMIKNFIISFKNN